MDTKHPHEYMIKAVFKKLNIPIDESGEYGGFHYSYNHDKTVAVQIGEADYEIHFNNDVNPRYAYAFVGDVSCRRECYFDFPLLEDPTFDPQNLIDEIVEFIKNWCV